MVALPLLSGEHAGCPLTLFNVALSRGDTEKETGAFATGTPEASISLIWSAPASPLGSASKLPSRELVNLPELDGLHVVDHAGRHQEQVRHVDRAHLCP